jgi:hypothetical protein
MEVVEQPRSFMQKMMFMRPKTDVTFFNPLKVHVQSTVTFDTLELRGKDFRLMNVQEYNRTLDGKVYAFTDYNLAFVPVGGDTQKVKLRVVPNGGTAKIEGREFSMLVLSLDYQQAYDQGLMDVIKDAQASKIWEVSDDGMDGDKKVREPSKTLYARLNDNTDSFRPTVFTATDQNGDGEFQESEIKKTTIEYWDFGREFDVADKITATEFYFIEVNREDGYIQMWKGTEVNEARIGVI